MYTLPILLNFLKNDLTYFVVFISISFTCRLSILANGKSGVCCSTLRVSGRASSLLQNNASAIPDLSNLETCHRRNKSSFNSGMIVYSRISQTDGPALTKHMLENFYKHEPFGLALGLTLGEVEHWFPRFLGEVLQYYEPVSFMAKDSDTNEIVGVAINIITEDGRSPPPSMKNHITKEKEPVKWEIVTFLEDLEEGVDPAKALNMSSSPQNKVFNCLFLSVAPGYGGKGIAKTLLRESEQEAKQSGVTIAMTDVTSKFSYLAVKALGYDCIKEVKYLNYKDHDGVAIFEGRDKELGVHTHARVMAKRI